ncbi:S-adenosylmethionine:tRNA ribosyltransferase-isomerase [Thermoactinomyces sp. DSM 45892]|uniref:S-adenosylmethionine:tRNA ribosyltransferase-isomerase n=1 Tax=Thermoactinomyces sp. DSM 45892 TaxID=1882753 RepID=UPI000898951C|nr:S-adenosylmethionine:tRNA ribosyltransferase-isomerase [Thermoactinomyces sp. DSM 45892]SDX97498.1 S-adenosylmethionine:tRNA ribosyltransferase-isomerase [Thermoactinomyces sp. DSM 45892]
MTTSLSFYLPDSLHASSPPERRGIRRDHVKCMVLHRQTDETTHTQFQHIDSYLEKDDLLVLNASRTIPAVFHVDWTRDHVLLQSQVEMRLARRIDATHWEALIVAAGVTLGDEFLFAPSLQATVTSLSDASLVTLQFSQSGNHLLESFYALGEPIRYEYIDQLWDLDYYQTVYGTVPGSVEMPSAGRAFSWELLLRLQQKGVRIAYIQLHTGLSYLLDDQAYLDPKKHIEEYLVPVSTVQEIKKAKKQRKRVIAVGTTVVRALETSIDGDGEIIPQTSWTNLHITADTKLRVVDGLITGFHEPEASHLDLLSSLINPERILHAYQEAIEHQYYWHEFGDMNFIL